MRSTPFAVVLVSILCVGAAPSRNEPRALLAPTQQVFHSPGDVTVRLILENSQAGCVGFFLDPNFSSIPTERRPLTLVRFTVTDEKGLEILPTDEIDGSKRYLGLHQLVLLECGTSYGRELPLARIPWSYSFRRGRYHARAHVEVKTGLFLQRRGMLSSLQRLWGFTEERTAAMTRDVSAESNEIEFEVR
jgi:hypothetical protein